MATRQEASAVVGIDLGTTHSCVAVWEEEYNKPTVIYNEEGQRTTPSFVSFTATNDRLVGAAAERHAVREPKNTIFDAKRLIGRKFSDPVVQNDIKLWPFKVIEGQNDKPLISVDYKGEQKHMHAEEISSLVLAKMRKIAETYLDSPVRNAVITVPAYFNDSQRTATINAGVIAGLNVLRITSEPTAAAIAYGFDKKTNWVGRRYILVFDFGGGTFDVSLVTVEDDVFQVKATAGNTHLGGEDFDNRMVNHFVEEFKKKNNVDISGNPRALRRLRTACEEAKKRLSFTHVTDVEVDALYDNIDLYSEIDRCNFEAMNMDIFEECMKTVERCLDDAMIRKSLVDDIVLVGGSSRIPKLQELLREFFDGKDLCLGINPDESVAYGAAVQGALLNEGIKNVPSMVVKDVTPLSLGISLSGDIMNVLIPRNTAIPVTKTRTYGTSGDNQRHVHVDVYQGERKRASDNCLLGGFFLFNIPFAPRGLHVDVAFSISENGTVVVSATEPTSGKTFELQMVNNNLSDEEIDKLIEEAETYRHEDQIFVSKGLVKNAMANCMYKIIEALQKEDIKSKLTSEEKEKINCAMRNAIQLSEKSDGLEFDVLENHYKELRRMFDEIIR